MISMFIKIAVPAVVIFGIIAGVIVGVVLTTTSENACATLRAPTNLTIDPAANFLTVSWANATDDCADHYEILVEMNGVVINDTTEVPIYVFEHTAYCTEVNISVTRYAEDGRRSATASQSHFRAVPDDTEIVTRIDFSVENEQVRASWEPLDTFQHCTVEYILKIDDSEAFTPLNENYHIFDDDDLEYCRETLLTLTPSIGGTSHTVVTERYTPEVPEQSEVLDGISFTIDNVGNLRAEWNLLVPFAYCTFGFKLQINQNQEFTPTDNNFHTFNRDDLEYCREMEFTLTPSIGDASYTPVTEKHTPQVQDQSEVIDDIRFSIDNDGNLRAEWNLLVPFAYCTFGFKLQINQNQEFTPTDNNFHTFNNDDLEYCREMEFTLTPSIDETSYAAVTEKHTPQVQDQSEVIDDIRFSIDNDGNLRAEWNQLVPFAYCTFGFTLQINQNQEFTPSDNNFHTFNHDDLEYCREMEFTLTPSIGEASYTPVIQKHTPQVPEQATVVDGISFNINNVGNLRAEWNVLVPFAYCTFGFMLQINEIDGFIPADIYFHTFNRDDLEYCREMEFTLTPSIGETSLTPVTEKHTPQVLEQAEVVDGISFRHNNVGNLRAEWNLLVPFEHCTFDFILKINEIEGFIPADINFHTFNHDDLEYCREMEFTLTPSIGETSCTPVTQTHIPQVQEQSTVVDGISFSIDNDGNQRAEWNLLVPFAYCTFGFKLQINQNQEFTPTDNNFHIFNDDDLEYCREMEFTLTPSIDETSYTPVTEKHTPQVQDQSKVIDNIRFSIDNDGNLRAEWNQLVPFAYCPFGFKLQINQNQDFTPTDNNFHIFNDDDLEYCREMEFTLTPSIDETSYAAVTEKHTPQVQDQSEVIDDIRFSIDNDGNLRAEWNLLVPFAYCPFGFKLQINQNEEFTPTDNNFHVFNDDDLEYCREMEFTLTPSIDETSYAAVTEKHTPQVQDQSEVIDDIRFSIDNDGNMTAEWSLLQPFTHCTFDFKLQINENQDITPTANNYHIFADVDWVYCREILLTLTPSIDGTSPTETTERHTPVIPDDFGTNFDPHTFDVFDNQLRMVWFLKDQGACAVTYTGYCVPLGENPPEVPTEISSPFQFPSCDVNDQSPHTFVVSIQPQLDIVEGDIPEDTEQIRPETVCTVLIDEEIVVGVPVCEVQNPPSVKFNDKNT